MVERLADYVAAHGPHLMTVETTSVCNLRCVMCPHSIGAVHRPKQMEYEILEKLWEPLRTAHDIQLHGIGEPLLSTSFWRFLEELRDFGPRINFNTNMTRITDAQIATIIRAPVSVMNVSLDAATAATYRKVRRYDFGLVLDNIRRVLAARDQGGFALPKVWINMTLMRENIEELPEFIRLAKALGVDMAMFWQMNDGETWTVERDGWKFDYAEQVLSRHAALSNAKVREAVALARELGVTIDMDFNKVMTFEEPAA